MIDEATLVAMKRVLGSPTLVLVTVNKQQNNAVFVL